MAGAFNDMESLLATRRARETEAYNSAQAAADQASAAFATPRRSKALLAMSAGFLKPTRSGSFGESLGSALEGYATASGLDDERELDRNSKLAAIAAGKARLMQDRAIGDFNSGMARFELPGLALKHRYDMEDLSDDGSDVPVFRPQLPGQRSDVPPGGAPTLAPVVPGAPAPAPQNPNTNVGSIAPVAEQAVAMAGDPVQPGDDAVNFPQTNGQLASLGTVASDAPQPGLPADPAATAPPPSPPAPQQMAQAAPAAVQQPQQPPVPTLAEQRLQWAQQVRDAAMSDPAKWARRPKNRAALEMANKTIAEAQQQQSRDVQNQLRSLEIDLKEDRVKRLETPMLVEQRKADMKRMEEVNAGAREAANTRQAIDSTEAARQRLVGGEAWRTGSNIQSRFINGLTELLVDGGEGALKQAVGSLTAGVIKAQNTGAISDGERRTFEAQVPGTQMGPNSARWVLDMGRAIASRAEEQANFYRRYMTTYGTTLGADDQWTKFINENPLIGMGMKGEPVVKAERAGQWQEYLKPPQYLIESGRFPQAGSAPRGITREEYDRLPSGASYPGPDGLIRRKQ